MQGIDNQQLANIIVALIGLTAGAVIGGGTVAVMFGRVVKSILESPVIITALEGAFASFPPEVRAAVRDTGRLLEEVADDEPTTTTTTTTSVS